MAQQRLVVLILAILILPPRIAGAAARLLEFQEETPALQMTEPAASVVSPDGAFVYVADYTSLHVFSRDPGTGALAWIQSVTNGVGGVTGLDRGTLALSPDGAHLYVTSYYSSALVVFSRNGGTGTLAWVETESVYALGYSYLGEVAVSPDGAHVYVSASYGGYVGVFSRNGVTGAVTFVAAVAAPAGLGASLPGLEISGDGAHVYVPSGYEDEVAVFSRDGGTGMLTFVESEAVTDAYRIALSPDGAHAYITSYPNLLTVYERNAGTGALTFTQTHVDGVGGITAMRGPSDVMVTPDGAHVYVTGGWDSGLVVFSRNAGTGHLTFVEEEVNGAGGVYGLNTPSGVTASPDGAHLYVTHGYYYSYPAGVAAFARNAGTGAVSQTHHVAADVSPAALALSPDGAHVYGAEGNKISVYGRDGGTGVLTRAGDVQDGFAGVDGIAAASAVVVSPDGAHVYATGAADSALAAFGRNGTTGALTFIEAERDGVGGVVGIGSATDLVMSADGLHLYVASPYSQAVSVFARNVGTGTLTQTQVHDATVVVGLDFPSSLALSPDGAHLYVGSSEGVVTFERDAGTGALTFAEALALETSTYYYPFYERAVSISPDGAFVYVNNPFARDLIRVFARDGVTGQLTPASTVRSTEGGLPYLDYRRHLVFSADGGVGYLAGGIFARHPGNGSLGFVASYQGGVSALGPLGEVYTASTQSVRRFTQGFSGCDGGPLPVCRAADAGVLQLSSGAPYAVWTWIGAGAVALGDLGDPDETDSYALCMWDESGPTPTLILRSLAPAGQNCSKTRACWTSTATGFTYRDRQRTPEGMSSMLLKAGTANQARVQANARKIHLPFPGLPLPVPVRVQLQTSAGECFEGVYSSPGVNDGRGFSAKPD